MTFRMKGPSVHEGTKGHKDALKLNFSMDKTMLLMVELDLLKLKLVKKTK